MGVGVGVGTAVGMATASVGGGDPATLVLFWLQDERTPAAINTANVAAANVAGIWDEHGAREKDFIGNKRPSV